MDSSDELSERLLALTNCLSNPAEARPDVRIGAAVADLLCYCAVTAPSADSKRLYWQKGIDVMDRACDIRRGNLSRAIDEARLRHLEDILASQQPIRRHTAIARNVAERFRFFLARAWEMLVGREDESVAWPQARFAPVWCDQRAVVQERAG